MTDNIQEDNLENDSKTVTESIQSEKYLTFFIDEQLYAIPSSEVVEIIRIQPITYLPRLPDFVKGVINLRGKIVPLLELRLKFNLGEKPYDEHTSIIVVEHGELSIGFIVDMVNDVTDIAEDEISSAPKLAKEGGNNYVSGIVHLEKNVALLVDIMRVLDNAQSVSTAVDGSEAK